MSFYGPSKGLGTAYDIVRESLEATVWEEAEQPLPVGHGSGTSTVLLCTCAGTRLATEKLATENHRISRSDPPAFSLILRVYMHGDECQFLRSY